MKEKEYLAVGHWHLQLMVIWWNYFVVFNISKLYLSFFNKNSLLKKVFLPKKNNNPSLQYGIEIFILYYIFLFILKVFVQFNLKTKISQRVGFDAFRLNVVHANIKVMRGHLVTQLRTKQVNNGLFIHFLETFWVFYPSKVVF